MPLIITAAEVSDVLSLPLNDSDGILARAQGIIETVSGADLTTADPESRYSARDIRLLRQAIVWQVAYLNAHPDIITQQPNIEAVAANGASISFFKSGGGDILLAPLAARILRRLSWAASSVSVSTLRPNPPANWWDRPATAPDPWVRI